MNTVHLWSQSVARRSIMGSERTHNPSPAAASLLGSKRVARAARKLKRLGKRSAHRGNPLPAVVATLVPIVSKYLHIGGPDPAKQAIRLQTLQTKATVALDDTPAGRAAYADLIAVSQRMEGHGVAINDVTVQAATELAAKVREHALSPAGVTGGAGTFATAVAPFATPIVRELARSARPRRARYPSYTDRYGRQRFSYKTPGSQFRIPAGATPTPGSPYSFFRGAVGAGGVGTTLAQGAVAAAAGAAAYLVTQKLLQYLGGRAQSAEEAGVNAARAHRETLLQLQAQGNGHPTATEKAEVNRAYRTKLIELGYDPVTFTRTRSGVERFLEDYNLLGG